MSHSAEVRAAWREACRRVHQTNAWTHTPPAAAVDLLVELARSDEPLTGSELARRAGRAQGVVTSRTLPRLSDLNLVAVVDGDRGDRGGRLPRLWSLTRRGRELAEALER